MSLLILQRSDSLSGPAFRPLRVDSGLQLLGRAGSAWPREHRSSAAGRDCTNCGCGLRRTSHELNIVGVVAAAAAGAVIGDNIGYEIGRLIGFPVLRCHGPRIGLDEQRLRLGQYLFRRYGGMIVFFGQFVAFLRMLAALLAGANRMPWPPFFFFNGGVIWSSSFGFGGYVLGFSVHRISGRLGSGC
jgi:membrane protein DedA with SNARE-associated domain